MAHRSRSINLAAHLISRADAILYSNGATKFDCRTADWWSRRGTSIAYVFALLYFLIPEQVAFAAERLAAPPAIVLSSAVTNGPRFEVRDYKAIGQTLPATPNLGSLL